MDSARLIFRFDLRRDQDTGLKVDSFRLSIRQMNAIFLNPHQLDPFRPVKSLGPIMVMPYIDSTLAQQAAELAALRSGSDGLLLAIHDVQRNGFIATINLAFRATDSPWFGYMAQDAFAGRSWMALALEAIQTEKAGLLGFNDGKWQGKLASFGLAQRQWATSNYSGDFFCPSYKSHYADTELTLIALEQGRYAYEPNSLLVEVDWNKDYAKVNYDDRKIYIERATKGFDGKVIDPKLRNMFI